MYAIVTGGFLVEEHGFLKHDKWVEVIITVADIIVMEDEKLFDLDHDSTRQRNEGHKSDVKLERECILHTLGEF